MTPRGPRAFLLVALACGLVPARAEAAVPAGFADTLVASVPGPTGLAFTPDGRLLITRQAGVLRVHDGSLLATPALTIPTAQICTNSERGLLGVAVDPEFTANHFIYLYYTVNGANGCKNRVSRFVLGDDSLVSPSSETVLVDNIHSTAGNHNAGDVHFGRDGYLYVSVGDGGCDYAGGGCAGSNDAARDRHVLLGKILRITRDGEIPPSNPFTGPDTARCNVTGSTSAGDTCQETYAWGLRNPFRIAFDPNAPGTRFFINDVGQGNREEIDLGQAGADYGWNCREGTRTNNTSGPCNPTPPGMVGPIFEYLRSTVPGTTASGCASITGGAFVPNGVWPPAYDGTYLFADYVCGWIFRLTESGGTWSAADFATNLGGSSATSLGFGPFGNGQALYYTTYEAGGQVRRISYSAGGANNAPVAVAAATPLSGPVPLTIDFDGSGSGDPDAGDTLTWFWDFGDGSPVVPSASPLASHTYTSPGTFTVTLRVRDDELAFSPPATLTVQPGNEPPAPVILAPAEGELFTVGQAFSLTGTATDPEDGTLPDGALSWTVILHHDEHTHPFLGPVAGNAVALTAPAPEDLLAAETSYLEIRLTATDSGGISETVVRDLRPRHVRLSFATSPPGLQLTIGGSAFTAPFDLTSWPDYVIAVDAPAQESGEETWVFSSWSDGGTGSHAITTPASDASYTATFVTATIEPVRFFTVTSASGENRIEWLNPETGPYAATMVRWTSSRPGPCTPPAGETEGTLLVSKAGTTGAPDDALHGGLANDGTEYCYSALVDGGAGFSSPLSGRGTPFDTGGAVKWRYQAGILALAPIGNGIGAVHVVDNGGVLHSMVKGASGGMWPALWEPVPLPGPSLGRPSTIGLPVPIGTATQVLFLGSQGGSVHAIDADRGTPAWIRPLSGPVFAAPSGHFTFFGGTRDHVLVGTRDATAPNRFVALRLADGVPAWEYDGSADGKTIGIVPGQATVDYVGKRVFFTSFAFGPGPDERDTVWCLDLETGARLWSVALPDAGTSPILRNGRLYVASHDVAAGGQVHALDAATGLSVWGSATFDTGLTEGPVKAFVGADRLSPAGRLLFSTTSKVWALDDPPGASTPPSAVAWVRDATIEGAATRIANPSTPVYLAGGPHVWVGSSDGKLYRLAYADGSTEVVITLDDGVPPAAVGSPTLDIREGFLYVGLEDGTVAGVQLP